VSGRAHWGTRLHAAGYRITGGRLLGRAGRHPVLLLGTVGRRTGERRTTPVQYLAEGDGFVVVASNRGAARPPAWYLNLRANPQALVQVGARRIEVQAQEATGRERAQLWQQLTDTNRYLKRAARKAERELPLMALVPSTSTTPPIGPREPAALSRGLRER
jgi:deazaflavin-dependent oxidoreductase (nitroreductase family)